VSGSDAEIFSRAADAIVAASQEVCRSNESLVRAMNGHGTSVSQVTINAGGVGVLISAVCAGLCVISFVFGAVLLIRQGQEIQGLRSTLETQQAYINVLHQGSQQ
jgi:hypothetical protein